MTHRRCARGNGMRYIRGSYAVSLYRSANWVTSKTIQGNIITRIVIPRVSSPDRIFYNNIC